MTALRWSSIGAGNPPVVHLKEASDPAWVGQGHELVFDDWASLEEMVNILQGAITQHQKDQPKKVRLRVYKPYEKRIILNYHCNEVDKTPFELAGPELRERIVADDPGYATEGIEVLIFSLRSEYIDELVAAIPTADQERHFAALEIVRSLQNDAED
jgi:hypothetical protein